jgi:hypothetical protein
MTTGAWIMLAFGCVVLYGGLVWSLVNTKKGQAKTGTQRTSRGKRKQ